MTLDSSLVEASASVSLLFQYAEGYTCQSAFFLAMPLLQKEKFFLYQATAGCSFK